MTEAQIKDIFEEMINRVIEDTGKTRDAAISILKHYLKSMRL